MGREARAQGVGGLRRRNPESRQTPWRRPGGRGVCEGRPTSTAGPAEAPGRARGDAADRGPGGRCARPEAGRGAGPARRKCRGRAFRGAPQGTPTSPAPQWTPPPPREDPADPARTPVDPAPHPSVPASAYPYPSGPRPSPTAVLQCAPPLVPQCTPLRRRNPTPSRVSSRPPSSAAPTWRAPLPRPRSGGGGLKPARPCGVEVRSQASS